MGRAARSLRYLCLLAAVLCGSSGALAKNVRWERILQGGAATAIGGAPAAALQEPPMVGRGLLCCWGRCSVSKHVQRPPTGLHAQE